MQKDSRVQFAEKSQGSTKPSITINNLIELAKEVSDRMILSKAEVCYS